MKLLFLDIDGVLNSARSIVALGHSYPKDNPKDVCFDPVAVGLIRKTCEECKLEIFVHSSWVGDKVNKEYLTEVFNHYGWETAKIVGGSSYEDRAERITNAIAKYNPEDYIVVDDTNLMKEFGDKAIVVDSMNGFNFDNYVQAMNHFGKKVGVFLI